MSAKDVMVRIKSDLEGLVGSKIRLTTNQGRKKVVEAEGVLEKTYPKIFTIRLNEDNNCRRVSYTYSDVLTNTVQLTVFRSNGELRIKYAN